MSSFDGISFKVITIDGQFFPNPVRDSDGLVHYRAGILIPNAANYTALQDRISLATFKRPQGSFAVNVHVEAGPGVKVLSVPARRKTLQSFNAILILLEPMGTALFDTGFHRAEAEWVITSDLTP